MSEPDDEHNLNQRPEDRQVRRYREAVVAGMTGMVVGLIPFGVVFSLATGIGMFSSICVTLLMGLMVAFPIGSWCGVFGWWLTQNSAVDSRLMACTLAALLEATVLGWSIVIAWESAW